MNHRLSASSVACAAWATVWFSACDSTFWTAGPDAGEDTPCEAECSASGTERCTASVAQACVADERGCLAWEGREDCAEGGQICELSGGRATCVTPETCVDLLRDQDETDVDCGGALCPPCAVGAGCGSGEDCESGVCTAGTCRLCGAGAVGCFGNWVRVCAADESAWEDLARCDPMAGFLCDATAAGCVAAAPIGNDTTGPTGEYYQFARFTTENSPFLGGADVDSFEDMIFVNRDGSHIDVYSVAVLDSDGDGFAEPSQHPDNPEEPGAIEERVLTLVETLDVPVGDINNNEFYVRGLGLEGGGGGLSIAFTRGVGAPGDIFEYDIATGLVATNVDVAVGLWSQLLGFDDVAERWFTAIPYERWVFSLDPIGNEWVLEFAYPNLSGDHSDGLEVVTDPKSGIAYVYVSDMTSDYIGQYRKGEDGRWVQENLFHYNQAGALDVEGMGFGAFNHFWATNNGYGDPLQSLYEIGGGDLDEYILE